MYEGKKEIVNKGSRVKDYWFLFILVFIFRVVVKSYIFYYC